MTAALPEKIDHDSWNAVLLATRDELEAQFRKWGRQDHPDGTGPSSLVLRAIADADPERDLAWSGAEKLADLAKKANASLVEGGALDWSDILLEEVFEALAEHASGPNLFVELIQTAAVALQWAASLQRASENGYSEGQQAGESAAKAAGGIVE